MDQPGPGANVASAGSLRTCSRASADASNRGTGAVLAHVAPVFELEISTTALGRIAARNQVEASSQAGERTAFPFADEVALHAFMVPDRRSRKGECRAVRYPVFGRAFDGGLRATLPGGIKGETAAFRIVVDRQVNHMATGRTVSLTWRSERTSDATQIPRVPEKRCQNG